MSLDVVSFYEKLDNDAQYAPARLAAGRMICYTLVDARDLPVFVSFRGGRADRDPQFTTRSGYTVVAHPRKRLDTNRQVVFYQKEAAGHTEHITEWLVPTPGGMRADNEESYTLSRKDCAKDLARLLRGAQLVPYESGKRLKEEWYARGRETEMTLERIQALAAIAKRGSNLPTIDAALLDSFN